MLDYHRQGCVTRSKPKFVSKEDGTLRLDHLGYTWYYSHAS